MTKEQSVLFMDVMAELLRFIQRFTLPSQFVHALTDFEDIGNNIRREMDSILGQSSNLDIFLESICS